MLFSVFNVLLGVVLGYGFFYNVYFFDEEFVIQSLFFFLVFVYMLGRLNRMSGVNYVYETAERFNTYNNKKNIFLCFTYEQLLLDVRVGLFFEFWFSNMVAAFYVRMSSLLLLLYRRDFLLYFEFVKFLYEGRPFVYLDLRSLLKFYFFLLNGISLLYYLLLEDCVEVLFGYILLRFLKFKRFLTKVTGFILNRGPFLFLNFGLRFLFKVEDCCVCADDINLAITQKEMRHSLVFDFFASFFFNYTRDCAFNPYLHANLSLKALKNFDTWLYFNIFCKLASWYGCGFGYCVMDLIENKQYAVVGLAEENFCSLSSTTMSLLYFESFGRFFSINDLASIYKI